MTYKLHSQGTFSFEIRRYRRVNGRVPVSEWLAELNPSVTSRVQAYIDRMKTGNFGNSRSIGGGILELKINYGPGYRVYFLRDGLSIVVLLCGGDKVRKLEIYDRRILSR